MHLPRFCLFACLCGLLATSPVRAADLSYMEMSLEDLMDVTLTSMSKRVQSLQDTAAAVTVLSGEDIHRSGATTIPEALRMVPGLMVGQSSTGEWAVASRGRSYNPTFDNKLLVLLDGRSVYTPLYSGVFWETLGTVMEDIERIEVIRGPGTSIWGANAVNGVINIITKSSQETLGGMASALYGTVEKGTGTVRYGGKFGEQNTFRVYGKYSNVDGLDDLDGNELHDGLQSGLAGFRVDMIPDADSSVMLKGEVDSGQLRGNLSYPDLTQGPVLLHNDSDTFDANLVGKYERSLGGGSSYSLETYYSRTTRGTDVWNFSYDSFDVDFQYQFVPWEHHLTQWGLGYRLDKSGMVVEPDHGIAFGHEDYADNLFSAFVQDEITLGNWVLTLGSKFQHNDQTGFEYMPSAHLLWHVTKEHSFWGAVSRSIRMPSIVERDAYYDLSLLPQIFPGYPGLLSMRGDDGMKSEDAMTYELGYRFIPSKNLSVEASSYVTRTEGLMSAGYSMTTPGFFPDHYRILGVANNDGSGIIYGTELSATWKPYAWWKLQGWYSYCEEDYKYNGSGDNLFADTYGHISPRHQFFVRTSFDMPYNTELDILGRYVSELQKLDIPDYATVDVRLGWRPQEKVEIALVGRNLIEQRHLECGNELVYGSGGALERSVFLKFQVDF